MVLAAGKILEFDSPQNLLKNRHSAFFSMAKDAGLVGSQDSWYIKSDKNVTDKYDVVTKWIENRLIWAKKIEKHV